MTWLNSPMKQGTGGREGSRSSVRLRHVFPFVARDRHGRLNGPVKVRGCFLLSARMGELLHGAHDPGDAFHAFEGFLDGLRDLVEEVGEVGGDEEFIEPGDVGAVAVLLLTAPSKSS